MQQGRAGQKKLIFSKKNNSNLYFRSILFFINLLHTLSFGPLNIHCSAKHVLGVYGMEALKYSQKRLFLEQRNDNKYSKMKYYIVFG